MYLGRKHKFCAPLKGKVMNETQMKRGSVIAKAGTMGAAGVALAACAACCAPLVSPVLAWFGLFGLSGLGLAATGWQLGTAVAAVLAMGGFLLLRQRKARNQPQKCQADGSCGCSV
jgi:hypothetical protein